LSDPAVLRPGSRGEAVRDLQVRLGGLGHEIPRVEAGSYGVATERVVRAFQESRGLRVDGICGPQTWAAVVESGWRLGDRLLYRTRPMLRGDDVAELQRRLNGLGFDAGREDGILGDDTTRALVEFQRNMDLPTDGICGASTIAVLDRVGTLAEGSVASVREREALRRGPHRLSGRRVFVAAAPGFERLAGTVVRELNEAGAGAALDATGATDPVLAAEANRYAAHLFLAFRAGDAPGCRCSYYESGRFRSEAGYAVADAVSRELAPILGGEPCVAGRTYAVLRETRMAAVICEPVALADVEAMRELVLRGADVAHAVVRGVRRGIEQPPPTADPDAPTP
jgi:N-acetylmuramoyl-L-alanine amidase